MGQRCQGTSNSCVSRPQVSDTLRQALYAISQGKIFEAYELYMAAGLYQSAHDLAVVELAPEAVIRQDFELLTTLFERMVSQSIDGWHLKGKARLSLSSSSPIALSHASPSGLSGLRPRHDTPPRAPRIHQRRSRARCGGGSRTREPRAHDTEIDGYPSGRVVSAE